MKNDSLLDLFKRYEIQPQLATQVNGGVLPLKDTTYVVVGYSGGGTSGSTIDIRLYYTMPGATTVCNQPDSMCGTNSPQVGMVFTELW